MKKQTKAETKKVFKVLLVTGAVFDLHVSKLCSTKNFEEHRKLYGTVYAVFNSSHRLIRVESKANILHEFRGDNLKFVSRL